MHHSSTVQVFKNIIKMGPTILFTHLKIILLQCFQFSIMKQGRGIGGAATAFEAARCGDA